MKAYLNQNGNPWRVFDEMFDVFPYEMFDNGWRTKAGRYPRVNAWENKDGLVVEAEVAGVDPAKLDVTAEGGTLTIKGEKRTRNGDGAETFQRSFNLPFELNPAQIKATLKNGLLSVSIPRKAAEKKQIAIQAL